MTDAATHVVGFLFSADRSKVALIRKNKPAFMEGKLNGLGGKIEPSDNSPHEAMVREFHEECGVLVPDWEYFATMKFREMSVEFFRAFTTDSRNLPLLQQTTSERVGWFDTERYHLYGPLTNLHWLIPLALDPDRPTAQIVDLS